MHIFSQIYFKFTKLHKKRLKFFAYGEHPFIIVNFIWSTNINQQGGDNNMNLKFKIHPWKRGKEKGENEKKIKEKRL